MGYSGLLHTGEIRGVLLVCLSMVIIPILSIGAMADDGATGAIGTAQIPALRTTPKSDRLDQGSCWYAIFFLSQAQAQSGWLSHPSQPPYPAPPFAQSVIPKTPPRKRDLNRPPEQTGLAVSGSTEPSELHGTSQDQKLRKEIPTKKRKSAEKGQKINKAVATGPVIWPASAGTKTLNKPTSSNSAGTKTLTKPIRRDVKETAQRTYSAFIEAAYENDLFRISNEAAKSPAVFAFRNCIASYSAREVGKEVDWSWASDLLIRATEGECRAQFDEVAQHLSKRFGEERVELIMQQLIETTLMPATEAAISSKPDARALSVPSH